MAPEPAKQPGKQLNAWFNELRDLWHLEDPLDALPRRLNPNRAKHAMDWPADIMLALMATARVTPGRHAYVVQRLEKRMDERLQHGRPNRVQHTIVEDLEYVARINPVRPREIPAMVRRNDPAQGAPAQAGNTPGGLLRDDRHAKQIAKQRIASKSQGKRKRNGENEEPMSDEEEQDNRKRARAGPLKRRRRASNGSEQGEEEGRNPDRPRDGRDNELPNEENGAGGAENQLAPPLIARPIDPRLQNIVIPTDDVLNSAFVRQQPMPPGANRPQRIELLRLLKQRTSHLRADAHIRRADARDSEIDYLIRGEEIRMEQEQNQEQDQADADPQPQDN